MIYDLSVNYMPDEFPDAPYQVSVIVSQDDNDWGYEDYGLSGGHATLKEALEHCAKSFDGLTWKKRNRQPLEPEMWEATVTI